MTFKLVSKVAIYTNESQLLVHHDVFSKERILHPGTLIHAKGAVAKDVETKTGMENANVSIKVLDEDRLQVTWKKPWWYSCKGYYDTEIIEGRDSLWLLDTPYQEVYRNTLPDAFTFLDKFRLPWLIKSRIKETKGEYVVRKETNIIYEPTLPSQSRR